jgi:hypothetical protein
MTDPIVVSYGELDAFRQCPLKHHLLYKLRYTKPPREDGALVKGSLWHMVMEIHYRVIKVVQDANNGRVPANKAQELGGYLRDTLRPLFQDLRSGEQTEVQALVEWMYNGYVAKYGLDEGWRIEAVEHAVQAPLGVNQAGTPIELKARLDLVVTDRETGLLMVVDHKSCANLPNDMELQLDDQFGLYCWLMGKVGRRTAIALHNAARTTRNQADFPGYTGKSKPQTMEQRHRRTLLNRSPKELQNLAKDALHAAVAAYPGDPAYRARYSSPDPRQCGWKCDVREPHLLLRQGRKISEVMLDAGFSINRERH